MNFIRNFDSFSKPRVFYKHQVPRDQISHQRDQLSQPRDQLSYTESQARGHSSQHRDSLSTTEGLLSQIRGHIAQRDYTGDHVSPAQAQLSPKEETCSQSSPKREEVTKHAPDDHVFLKPEGLPPRHHANSAGSVQRATSEYSGSGSTYLAANQHQAADYYHHQDARNRDEALPGFSGAGIKAEYANSTSDSEYSYTSSAAGSQSADYVDGGHRMSSPDEMIGTGGHDQRSEGQLASPTPKVSSTTGPEEIGKNLKFYTVKTALV
jgi:hypothetical protein